MRTIVLEELHKLLLERRLDYFWGWSDCVTLGMLQSLCGPGAHIHSVLLVLVFLGSSLGPVAVVGTAMSAKLTV